MTAQALSSAERDRLIRLLGLLGSDFDGERATAAAMASRFIRERRLTWADVIGAKPPAFPEPQRPTWREAATPTDASNDLDLVLRNLGALSPWEQQFMRSVSGRSRWFPKQRARFAEIAAKVRAKTTGARA